MSNNGPTSEFQSGRPDTDQPPARAPFAGRTQRNRQDWTRLVTWRLPFWVALIFLIGGIILGAMAFGGGGSPAPSATSGGASLKTTCDSNPSNFIKLDSELLAADSGIKKGGTSTRLDNGLIAGKVVQQAISLSQAHGHKSEAFIALVADLYQEIGPVDLTAALNGSHVSSVTSENEAFIDLYKYAAAQFAPYNSTLAQQGAARANRDGAAFLTTTNVCS